MRPAWALLAALLVGPPALAQLPPPAASSAPAASAPAASAPGAPVASAARPVPRRYIEPVEPPRTEGDDLEPSYFDTPFLVLRWSLGPAVAGIGQVGAEAKLARKLSALGHLSVGRVKTSDRVTLAEQRQTLVEVHGGLRYYVVGSMGAGVYAGADASYGIIDTDQLIVTPLLSTSSGLVTGVVMGFQFSYYSVVLDMTLIGRYRAYHPSVEPPSPPGVDKPGDVQFGAMLGVGYMF